MWVRYGIEMSGGNGVIFDLQPAIHIFRNSINLDPIKNEKTTIASAACCDKFGGIDHCIFQCVVIVQKIIRLFMTSC